MAKEKNKPEGIGIIGVFYYFGAAVTLFFATILFSAFDALGDPEIASYLGESSPSSGLIMAIAIFLVGLSILQYFAGRDLIKGKSWAKILVSVFASLGVIAGIVTAVGGTVASGIFITILNGLIVWYLNFTEETKKFFN